MTEHEHLEQDYLQSYRVPEGCLIITAGLMAFGVMFLITMVGLLIKALS